MQQSAQRKYTTIFLLLCTLFVLVACGQNNDPDPATPTPPPEVISDSAIKIVVESNGIYAVSQRDMQNAGLEISTLDASQLSLSLMGEPIPYVIEDDLIVFYGTASDSRYSRANPYILRSGEAGQQIGKWTAAPSVGEVNAILQTVTAEQNWAYEQRAAENGAGADVWFWKRIVNVGEDAVFEFELDVPAVADGSAEINLHLWGLTDIADTDPDHDFDLLLNGEKLDSITFDGSVFYTGTVSFDAGLLQAGKNTFTVDNSVPGNVRLDQFYFNYATLNFPAPTVAVDERLSFGGVEGDVAIADFDAAPLVFDVRNANSPQRVEASYEDGMAKFAVSADMQIAAASPDGYLSASSIAPLIETDLRETSNQADLLIVTTRALSPELDPLVTARLDQGLTVKIAHVDELYDEFSAGAVTPDAIQAFVTYAYENWQDPAPQYLFLVGDATTDMLGNAATRPDDPVRPPANLVPSPIVDVNHGGETVADARLTDVDGDLKPDLAVGRWPVDSAEDVRNLVRRTIAYEAGTVSDRALFTYDGTSNEFSSFTDRIIQQSGLPEDQAILFDGPTSEDVTSEWSEGAWLISYVGHGSVNLWGADEVLSQEAVAQIGGNGTPPIVIQFSCLTGQFGYWEADSISETMLKHEQGPVLLVASTSLTLSSHQSPFAIAFVEGLQNPDFERIGDALQAAKAGLDTENNAGIQEISDTFGLIGDPSARIQRPEAIAASQ